jgi:pimeloyl-ACP methyl ester carboxylesterase
MPSDLTNQSIKLNEGRTLGYAEFGELTGKVVFHFNGAGGSRLERPGDESILNNLDIRLVTTDRPGHGLSDPQSDRKLLDWRWPLLENQRKPWIKAGIWIGNASISEPWLPRLL